MVCCMAGELLMTLIGRVRWTASDWLRSWLNLFLGEGDRKGLKLVLHICSGGRVGGDMVEYALIIVYVLGTAGGSGTRTMEGRPTARLDSVRVGGEYVGGVVFRQRGKTWDEHAVSKTREGQGTAVAGRHAGERCESQGRRESGAWLRTCEMKECCEWAHIILMTGPGGRRGAAMKHNAIAGLDVWTSPTRQCRRAQVALDDSLSALPLRPCTCTCYRDYDCALAALVWGWGLKLSLCKQPRCPSSSQPWL